MVKAVTAYRHSLCGVTAALTVMALLAPSPLIFGQTADVTRGCIPLPVSFEAPDGLSAHYWNFGDGASSELQNPQHTYVTAGTFLVELFEGVNGPKHGEIEVTVYSQPVVEFSVDTTNGCNPLIVQFTSSVDKHAEITVVGYEWTFGDGTTSADPNPQHTFTTAGTFQISLEIITDPELCGASEIKSEYIRVGDVNFTFDRYAECETPAQFNITSVTPDAEGNSYQWEFGNGAVSTLRDPGMVVFTEEGTYEVCLTITNDAVCTGTRCRQVTVGRPQIVLDIPDPICYDQPAVFRHETGTIFTSWTFGPDALPNASNANPTSVRFRQEGDVEVTLVAFTDPVCRSDTTFTINVDRPDAGFSFDPWVTCHEPAVFSVVADNPDMASYFWNGTPGGPEHEIVHYHVPPPPEDTFYLNVADSVLLGLTVTSEAGCTTRDTHIVAQHLPAALFAPSPTKGCAPLTVDFLDVSSAIEDITSWTWIYGDGMEFQTGTGGTHQHTYTEPGEYYVKLMIETETGCRDTSYGIWIEVGEEIAPQYTIDKTEICLGDSISIAFTNTDPRIDSWQFDTDDHRFDHCWSGPTATHTFAHTPGTYDVHATVEYNGCFSTISEEDLIQVHGARADIGYMITCDAPYDVMLWDESRGGDVVSWTLPSGENTSGDSLLIHFDSTGDYTVYLTAEDTEHACPAHTDSAALHIRDIEAHFEIPERVCDNVPMMLDATGSVDVDDDCHKGYLWLLPTRRPYETDSSVIQYVYAKRGDQELTLIVEDIHGCTDTLTQTTTSYGIDAGITVDDDRICFPAMPLNFAANASGDTTLESIEWSFGASGQDVSFLFTEEHTAGDTIIPVQLEVSDVLGCKEQLQTVISTYQPQSEITDFEVANICVGDSIWFEASDFTEEGSFLNYNWDFGGLGSDDRQRPTFTFLAPGFHDVILNYSEDASGCPGPPDTLKIQAVDVPMAGYTTDVDGMETICHPATIAFSNTSIVEGPVTYIWNTGIGVPSQAINPVFTFPRGTYDVQLIAMSQYGCADTTGRQFTLVGPDGTLVADRNTVCLGEEITFNIVDAVDVDLYAWDYGDGTAFSGLPPVTHAYTFRPPGGTTIASVVLESVETGCDYVDTLHIDISDIVADFETIDSLEYCAGRIQFQDLSTNASQWLWDFGNGGTSSEQNPVYIFPGLGEYPVTLIITDVASGCTDTVSKDVLIDMVPEYVAMPNVFSPNRDADQRNEYFNIAIDEGYADFVEVTEFKVYNRWGDLVYDNDDPDNGWDGMYDGVEAPAEVYAYFINVRIIECMDMQYKGNVTLVR